MTVRWEYVSPPILLGTTILAGVVQLLVFPVANTTITVQAVMESLFLIVVVVGIFVIPTTHELSELSIDEAEAIYPPVLMGLGLFAIRAITDVLDEFLRYPPGSLTLLEDGTMILGVVSLLVGLVRWAEVRERQARLLRDHRDRLDRQNERLDAFASIVSHDLRNPLNVAMGRLEIVRGAHADEDFDAIEGALDRMDAIIGDVLALAQVGVDAIEPASVSLHNSVEHAWTGVESGDASLETVLPESFRVRADGSYLQQLLENLFRNAIDHGGPTVAIRVRRLDDGFAVEDTGPGIPAENRERVFEPGYSTREEGSGFGLSIVTQIADAHGWKVGVADGHDGGARFEITGVTVVE